MVSRSDRRGIVRVACAAAILIGVSAGTAQAGIIVVDDFSDANGPWPVVQSVVGNTPVDETGLAGVLGGSRSSVISAKSLGIPGLDSVTGAVVAGVFDYTTSSGANGNFSLFYDGPAGDLNADLSSLSAFGIEIVLFDFGNNQPMPVTVTLDDGANTATGNQVVNIAGGQTISMPFASFTNIGALDLTSIDSILIEFDPGLGNDLRLGEITVVPTPAVLALFGAAGLLGSRRRRA